VEITAANVLQSFWTSLSKAEKRVLFLDYDGTLAPFRIKRDEAIPYDGVIEVIKRIISGGTRVVIVTGRGVNELPSLLNITPLPEIWGTHGIERMRSNGSIERLEFDPSINALLSKAADIARRHVQSECIETKYGCVALHWRGLTDREANNLKAAVEPAWDEIAQQDMLVLHGFSGGLELRLRGRDKGFAVRTVLDEEGEGVIAAYLGDDWTDEDAFRAIKGRGLPVLVLEDYRETEAELWLRPPDELLKFLREWEAVQY